MVRALAASLFLLLAALPAAALEGDFVGTMRGADGALFPGSRTGAYGFVRGADGTVTYFRVNGFETRARSLDAEGRVVGTFSGADGRERTFVIRVPRGAAYVELSLDPDADDLVA